MNTLETKHNAQIKTRDPQKLLFEDPFELPCCGGVMVGYYIEGEACKHCGKHFPPLCLDCGQPGEWRDDEVICDECL